MYSKLKKYLQERLSARGQEFQFTVTQLRNKLKELISECKKAALTIKTATRIDRFQEQKSYGSWFSMLFSLVKTRDSCQPERAVEPSTGGSEDVDGQSIASPASSLEESEQSTVKAPSDDKKLFVPVKNRGKKRKMYPRVLLNVWRSCLRETQLKSFSSLIRKRTKKLEDMSYSSCK